MEKNISKKILIYTDGSCLKNPGAGGWAAISVDSVSQEIYWEIFGEEFSTTNNRMEMIAVIEALKKIKNHFENFSEMEFELFSDSNLIIQTINQGWKKKANTDLWNDLENEKKDLNIKFFWVKGHHEDEFNHRCDELAQAAANSAEKKLKKNPQLLDTVNYQGSKRTLF